MYTQDVHTYDKGGISKKQYSFNNFLSFKSDPRAVLVAIAIPIFTTQLRKSKAATDQANARSLYATLVADYLDDNKVDEDASPKSLSGKGTITVGSNAFDFSDVTTSLTIDTNGEPKVKLETNGESFSYPSGSGSSSTSGG